MVSEPTSYTEKNEITTKELILNIQDWFKYLLGRWQIFLIAGVVGGGLGLVYAWHKPPAYTATTTFVLEGSDGKTGLSQFAGVAAMAGIDLGGNAGGLFQGDNILELYKSRNMLAQTLLSKTHPDSNELLIDRYLMVTQMKEGWEERPELLTLDFRGDPTGLNTETRRLQDSIIFKLVNMIKEDNLTVSRPDKKLSIVQVDVTSPDEVFSKSFNENLVKCVNNFYIQTKTKKSINNIAILEAKVDSVRTVMERAIYSAAKVSDITPNLNSTRQAQRVAPMQEARFSAETNQTILAQLIQNLEMTKMTLLQEQPLIQLVDQPLYPLKVQRLGKLKGIIIGGFLVGFLTLIFLIVKKWYRDVMTEEK